MKRLSQNLKRKVQKSMSHVALVASVSAAPTVQSANAEPFARIETYLNSTQFESGFRAATNCEFELLTKAIENLPKPETFQKLAVEDRVLLIHKVTNQLWRRSSAINGEELEKLGEVLNSLMTVSVVRLNEFRAELLAIALELSRIGSLTRELSASATQDLMAFLNSVAQLNGLPTIEDDDFKEATAVFADEVKAQAQMIEEIQTRATN